MSGARRLGWLGPSRSCAGSILLVAAVYAATLFHVEVRGFWILDNAIRFLQLEAIVASDYRDFSLAWPGRELDPELHFNPLPHPFSHVEDGTIYAFYPPFFATLSSLPFRIVGFAGLYLLPALSALLTLAALAHVATRMGLGAAGRHALVLVAGLCTPLWFYAVVFWEHMPAACLSSWAVALLLDFLEDGKERRLVGASVLATLSVYFRDELYLFCALLAGAALLLAPAHRLRAAVLAAATMALAILPLWLFQAWALGHPLGLHLGAQNATGLAEHFAARPLVVYLLFLAFVANVVPSLLLSSPFAIGFLTRPGLPARVFAWALPAAALLAVVCCGLSLAGFTLSPSPIGWLNQTNGLFSGTPVLLLAFVRLRAADDDATRARLAHRVWLLALGYAALYALAAPALGSRGIHWGNRLLLAVYPLLALLAVTNLSTWFGRYGHARPLGALALALAVALSAGAQTYSIHLLALRKDFSFRLSRALSERPEPVVVTTVWWAAPELFAASRTKSIFRAASAADLERLLAKLHGAGHDHALLVARRGEGGGALVKRVDDSGLDFFGLDILRIETDQ